MSLITGIQVEVHFLIGELGSGVRALYPLRKTLNDLIGSSTVISEFSLAENSSSEQKKTMYIFFRLHFPNFYRNTVEIVRNDTDRNKQIRRYSLSSLQSLKVNYTVTQ